MQKYNISIEMSVFASHIVSLLISIICYTIRSLIKLMKKDDITSIKSISRIIDYTIIISQIIRKVGVFFPFATHAKERENERNSLNFFVISMPSTLLFDKCFKSYNDAKAHTQSAETYRYSFWPQKSA